MAQSFKSLTVPESASTIGTSLCIGNFDGCHLGHQALLENTLHLARKHQTLAIALTFSPHPMTFFQTKGPFQPLFTPEQRRASLLHFGLDAVVALCFDQELRELSPDAFVNEILIDRLNTKHITIGYDFRFGKNRSGDANTLRKFESQGAFSLSVIDPLQYEQTPVSSSQIRYLLNESGDCNLATRLLGHPHAVVGTIRTGKQLGRSIGFPTINVHETVQILPSVGVFAGYVALGIKATNLFALGNLELFPAMFNIGRRPTVEEAGAPIKLEAHLVDATFESDELYNQDCTCIFITRLRDELKFPSLDALKSQIKRDTKNGKEALLKDDFLKHFSKQN